MKITITSPSFSANTILQNELHKYFIDTKLNLNGKRFNEEELIQYLHDADAIIVGLEKIDDKLLSHLPKLKIIAKYGVGLNNIDIEACQKRDIKIGWTGGVNRLSVVELTLVYMLILALKL